MNTRDRNTGLAPLTSEEMAAIHICAIGTLAIKWISVSTVLHYHKEQLLKLLQQLDQEALEEIANALTAISADFHGRGDALSKEASVILQETAITFWNKYSDGEDASWTKIGGHRFKNEHVSLRDPYFKGGTVDAPASANVGADMPERATTPVAPSQSVLRDALTIGVLPLCPM